MKNKTQRRSKTKTSASAVSMNQALSELDQYLNEAGQFLSEDDKKRLTMIDWDRLSPKQQDEFMVQALEKLLQPGVQPRQPPAEAPSFGVSLLWLFLTKKDREALIGDLAEEYQEALTRFGPGTAKLLFYKQVLTSLAPVFRAWGANLVKWGLLGFLEELFRRIAH